MRQHHHTDHRNNNTPDIWWNHDPSNRKNLVINVIFDGAVERHPFCQVYPEVTNPRYLESFDL